MAETEWNTTASTWRHRCSITGQNYTSTTERNTETLNLY